MTVENLTLNVKTTIGDSDKKITSLANALGNLQAKAAALTGLSNLSALASAMSAMSSARISSTVFTGMANGISKLTTALQGLTMDNVTLLSNLATVMNGLSGSGVKASSFSGLAKGIENLSVALKQITTDDIANLTALSGALRNLNNVNLAGLGNASSISKAASSLHETSKGIDEVAKSAKNAESPLSNFIGSLKRIAFYRIVRTIIKEITEAFKEGLENAYEWSKLMGTELAPALDRIATASLQMKNQLGAALGELIVALEPMIVELIHLITFLAEAFTWLFATLNGSEFYMVAEEAATSWKDADKAAKEYKRTILGFDVINRLNGPGSGGKAIDYTTMFNQTPAGVREFDFKWQDITPFFAPLDDWIDSTLEMLYELDALLQKIFGKSYSLDLDLHWNVNPIPTLEKVKQWLDDLVADSPYEVVFESSWVLDPVPELELEPSFVLDPIPELSEELNNALETLDIPEIEIGYEVLSPVPELVSVGEEIAAELMRQADAYSKAYQDVTETLNRSVEEVATAAESMNRTTDGVKSNVLRTLDTIKNENNAFLNDLSVQVDTHGATIASSVDNYLGQSESRIHTFHDSKKLFENWSVDTRSSVGTAMSGVNSAVNGALSNAGNNYVEFVNRTGVDTGKWAETTGGAFAEWGTAVNTEVADTLDSAYENYKGFAEATDQTVPAWRSSRNAIRNAAIGIAGLTAAAVAASFVLSSGGGSFGNRLENFYGYASGGFPNSGSLFIAREAGPELVGSIGGHTAVVNNDQIVEAVSSGVYEAVSSAMGSGNKNVSVHVYLDSREIKSGQQRLARAVGG